MHDRSKDAFCLDSTFVVSIARWWFGPPHSIWETPSPIWRMPQPSSFEWSPMFSSLRLNMFLPWWWYHYGRLFLALSVIVPLHSIPYGIPPTCISSLSLAWHLLVPLFAPLIASIFYAHCTTITFQWGFIDIYDLYLLPAWVGPIPSTFLLLSHDYDKVWDPLQCHMGVYPWLLPPHD